MASLNASQPLILASKSSARASLLSGAGLIFESLSAHVDEGAVKEGLLDAGAEPCAIAESLAEMKAMQISLQHISAIVIGADQLLVCEGKLYSKATDIEGVKVQLRELRGRDHQLISAISVVQGGKQIWHINDNATLTMRNFSEAFLDDYCALVGPKLLSSVGGYHLEGRGSQLFTKIHGDYFTILGLPLMPLLGFLRQHGALLP